MSYRVTLPTTGYVVLHTHTTDGHEPSTGLIFNGARSADEAREKFDRETARLREQAPRDVLHHRVLVHRIHSDGRGDEVLAEATVRGAGPALSDPTEQGR